MAAKDPQPETVIITISDDYEPISSGTNEKVVGIIPDILNAIFKKYPQYKLKILGLPWARAQQLVEKGDSDGMFTIPTDARAQYARFSKEIGFTQSFNFYTYPFHPKLKQLSAVKSYSDLKNFVVCEYLGSGWAKQNLEGNVKEFVYSKTVATKIESLVNRRCDLIVESDLITRFVGAKIPGGNRLVKVSNLNQKVHIHFQISKISRKKQLIKIFDKEILDLRKSGEFQKILDKWSK